MDCRVISAFTRVLDALCPAMTPAVLRIAPRADGLHVPVAIFIVNDRPETMERIRPHVKVGSSMTPQRGRCTPVSRAQRSTKWCAADTDLGFTRDRRSDARKSGKPDLRGSLRSVAVPDQRCHSASKTRVNALMTSLALALHRIRDTCDPACVPISRCQTALLNAAPRGAAPQVMASACSAMGSQDDAARSMNCGSISGCVGTMSVRMIVPSLRLKNSSGFQTPPFQAIVTRSR